MSGIYGTWTILRSNHVSNTSSRLARVFVTVQVSYPYISTAGKYISNIATLNRLIPLHTNFTLTDASRRPCEGEKPKIDQFFQFLELKYRHTLTDQGKIWNARLNIFYVLRWQISPWSIRSVDLLERNTADLTTFGLWRSNVTVMPKCKL